MCILLRGYFIEMFVWLVYHNSLCCQMIDENNKFFKYTACRRRFETYTKRGNYIILQEKKKIYRVYIGYGYKSSDNIYYPREPENILI